MGITYSPKKTSSEIHAERRRSRHFILSLGGCQSGTLYMTREEADKAASEWLRNNASATVYVYDA